MKKNTVKLFILALALGSGLVASAQDAKRKGRAFQTNVAELEKLAEKYRLEDIEKDKKVLELSKLNNWPLVIRKDNGVYMKLTDVDYEGKPLYTTTFNEGSAITSRVDKLHPGGSSGLDLTGMFSNGDRINIGVWDGEYPKVTHAEFVGRFESMDGPASDFKDHPTHVLGTIIATGIDPAARGMAYEGFGRVANFDNDLSEMAINAPTLVLSNHSYGIPALTTGVYFGIYAKRVDEITFDAPYYQPVFAAGNEGDGTYDNLTDRGLSKNGITVAAINKLDWVNSTTPQIANFSNWGPSDDNRIKPDISAAGVNLYSTLAGDVPYGVMSGTSMACPSVTGALALIQQYYAELHTAPEDIDFEKTYMLSSTLRALMAHCATEAGTVGPDPIFGWGVINAEKMADVITKEGTQTLLLEDILTVDQVFEIDVEALGDQPLIATLAWTDPAPNIADDGATSSAVIVNNLDIKVIKGTTNNFPWKLAASPSSSAIKGDNNVDTIEKVEVASPSGTYKIQVSHKGTTLVNPANTSQPQQVYSLVISGVDATLDSEEFTKDSFSVWPNPAKESLNISMVSALENEAKAIIYDMQGRVVLQSSISTTDTELNIEGLSSGVYLVNVDNGNKSEVKKFIVK